MSRMRGPVTMRAGGQQRAAAARDSPLKCICNLCNCGGHRCADFNLWADGGGDSSGQDPKRHSSRAQSMDDDNDNLMGSSGNHESDGGGMTPRCDHRADEERYLTAGVTRGRATTPSQPGEEHHQRYARSPAQTNGRRQEDEGQAAQEQELLHVLVTRPEIASKPRDNILFEGDMDLRTTFETSYEALARMRLEHWKIRQAQQCERARAGESSSPLSHALEDTQHVSDQASATNGKGGAASEHQLGSPRADAHHDRDPDAHHQVDGSGGPIGARMIKSPARLRGGDSLVGTGLALGQVQHRDQLLMQQEHREQARDLNSPSAGAARGHAGQAGRAAARQNQATGRRPEPTQSGREQASPFVDPDLSPIIVYDANLNRLERVGLRKRSKYRPSTSLRPGGRAGFFGQSSLDEQGLPANGHEHGPERKAHAEREEENHQLTTRQRVVSPGGEFCLHDGAAGDTSENLNRDRMAGGDKCGRKHNLSHVNRIDHIKQFNLVENTDPLMREFRDKATLTEGELTFTEQPRERSDGHHERQQLIDDDTTPQAAAAAAATLASDERNLTLAEEAAAVAEIQRVTSLGLDGRHADGNSRDTRTPKAHGSEAATGPEAASSTRPNANDNSAASPLAEARRQARMQRVCQNQSFNIHENEYPEAKGGKLTSCIKIGGRDTMDQDSTGGPSRQSMVSPHTGGVGLMTTTANGRRSGSNLFRESPDFILTTAGRGRAADEKHSRQMDNKQQTLEGHVDEGVLAKSVSRSSNLHVDFDGKEDQDRLAGHESAASGGGCSECRVLSLDHDFEFVGLRSGHKYFVEKHLNAEEVSIGEMT